MHELSWPTCVKEIRNKEQNQIAFGGLHDCVKTMQTVLEKITSLNLSELCKLCQKVANWVRKGMQTVSDRDFSRIFGQNSGCKLSQKVANCVRTMQTMSALCKLCQHYANYVRKMQTVSEITKDFFSNCHATYHNKWFSLIISNN